MRKVFSAYEHPESIIAQISGAIPSEVGITLEKAYKLSPQLVAFKKQYKHEFEQMERLEGRISHASTHAGGVIIYPNLSKYIPVHTDSDDRTRRVVSFDKKMAEDMGFCKIDCLGLEALSTLNDTVKSIKALEGIDVHLDEIDYEDPAIYEDLRRGDVYGLFQLENQKDLTVKQQPRCFDDIVAISSICRPGTCDVDQYLDRRKNQNFTIPQEEEWYMRKSEGLIIYQEQFLLHCKTYAGWDIAFADKNVRKNKGLKTDVALRDKFINDCVSNGYSRAIGESKWEEIVSVAGEGYSFNASHAVSYSIITYRNAWLKHYYPIHFYASLLTKLYNDDKKKHLLPDVIAECKSRGIKILPPDINLSKNNFIPTKEGIRFAISSVSGLGETAQAHLAELKPIQSLEDLVTRATRKYMRENVVDNLIKAGCFDAIGQTRYDILLSYKALIKSKKEVLKKEDMEYEYEALGVYLQQHPMDKYAFKPFNQFKEKQSCLIGGIVKKVEEKLDKKGNTMAFITLETKYGNVKCLAFSSYWNKNERKKFSDNALVMINGTRSGDACIINVCTPITS